MHEVDLAVVGAGAAGLSAAAAAARAGLSVLVIERLGAGGQVMTVDRIDNFPGHPQGLSGYELGPMLQEEAESAGAAFMLADVQSVDPGVDRHTLHCGDETVSARAVLVACGSQRRPLGVPGEQDYDGRGVSHCASCDGPLYRGRGVCVAGGGDSAIGEALVLAPHAAAVSVVFPEPLPHAQAYLLEGLREWPHVELIGGSRVIEIVGDATGVTGVVVQGAGAGPRALPVHGVFVYAGLQPATDFLRGVVQLDAAGRIETDARLLSSAAGIYAAGDVRSGADYLLSAAAAEGARAAQSIVEDLRPRAP